MKLRKNDTLTLKIEDITNLGFGVAKSDGEVIFISDTVPGDEVEARIIKVASSFAVAKCERLITPSPSRTDSRCAV